MSTREVRWLDNLTTAVLVFDRQLKLQAINNSAEALLSISARKAIGLSADQLLPEAPVITCALQQAFTEQQPLTEHEVQLNLPGAGATTVDYTITPLSDGIRAPEVLLELVNVERMHKIGREENIDAQQDVTRALLRGMAHEVKNPLGGIRGAAQLLERELNSESLREHTRIIIGEVDRLRNLLDRMLLPDGVMHQVRVNIHEIIEHVRSLAQAEAGGIVVHRDYDPSLPEMLVDRDQLVQAFLNIVKNAVQAVDQGGDITLRTRALRQMTINGHRHKLAVRADVIDTGSGVAPEIADQIFYPMVTSRPEGTGLGLAIARSLVHRQGGTMEFNSRPGHTVFSILLPIHDNNA